MKKNVRNRHHPTPTRTRRCRGRCSAGFWPARARQIPRGREPAEQHRLYRRVITDCSPPIARAHRHDDVDAVVHAHAEDEREGEHVEEIQRQCRRAFSEASIAPNVKRQADHEHGASGKTRRIEQPEQHDIEGDHDRAELDHLALRPRARDPAAYRSSQRDGKARRRCAAR